MDNIKGAVDWIFTHPVPRTFGHVLSTIVGGLLTGWLLNEITVSGTIVWSMARTADATLGLVTYVIVAGAYFSYMYKVETSLDRWNDPAYRKARATKELWPDFMDEGRQRIRNGEYASLEQLRRELLGHE